MKAIFQGPFSAEIDIIDYKIIRQYYSSGGHAILLLFSSEYFEIFNENMGIKVPGICVNGEQFYDVEIKGSRIYRNNPTQMDVIIKVLL